MEYSKKVVIGVVALVLGVALFCQILYPDVPSVPIVLTAQQQAQADEVADKAEAKYEADKQKKAAKDAEMQARYYLRHWDDEVAIPVRIVP